MKNMPKKYTYKDLEQRIQELERVEFLLNRSVRELKKSKANYRQLFNEIKVGITVYEGIDGGKDFVLRDINAAGERLGNVKKSKILGKSLKKIQLNIDESGLLSVLQKVWQTGKAENYSEKLYGDKKLQGWFDNYVYKLESGEVAVMLTDKTHSMFIEESFQRSEALLNATQRLTRVGGWEWNVEKESMFWTDENYRIHGFQPNEITPGSVKHIEKSLECYDPEDRPIVMEAFRNCVKRGQPYDLEFPFILSTGDKKWIRTKAEPVLDGDRITKVIGNIIDITEHKKMEEARHESEERFREVFNNMGTGVAIYEATENGNDFIFKDINRAGLVSSQLDHHQLVGKSVQEVFPNIGEMGLLDVFKRVWETGIATRFPDSFYQDNRITLWVENYVCKLPSGEIVVVYDDITARKKVEEKLVRAKDEWTSTFDAMGDIVTILGKDMRIVRANKAAYDFFQEEYGKLNGKYCYEVFTGTLDPCPVCPLFATLQDMGNHCGILHHEQLDKLFHVSSSAITDDNGEIQYLIHVARDITEQRRLEENLFQAHKMEAIGTLAGGIAHDFNNILSAIIGYSELAKDHISFNNPAQKDIDTVIESSMRAVDLVKQILTFSRKSTQDLQSCMPHLIVKEALKMLRSTLPTTIGIEEKIVSDCGSIMADPINVHQTVVNLCTNAFHAMENEKGTLSVSLYRKEIGAEDIPDSDVSPGSFIVLSVGDTGHGMDERTIQRIFEPYFSTKEVAKGTGLGLAVIHGIVRDYKGFIKVESKAGKGSTFLVHFPAIEDGVSVQKITAGESLFTGNERILVVDDENTIVNLQKTILERLGYTTTATTDSRDAIEKIRSHPDHFDLLITDQSMPYLSGVELAEEVLKIKPNMPIIICTGYSSAITEEGALAIGIKKYAKKPVDKSTLATIVREVLDGNE